MTMAIVSKIEPAPLGRRVVASIVDWIVLFPLVVVLYPLWKDRLWGGRSIGKRLTGLQVIHSHTGKMIGLRRAMLRNVSLLITFGLGALLVFTNDSNRHLGDLIARTLVVQRLE